MSNTFEIRGQLKLVSDIGDVKSNLTIIQNEMKKLKLPANLKSSFTETFSKLETEIEKYQNQLQNGFKSKSDVTGLEKTAKQIIDLFKQLGTDIQDLSKFDLKQMFSDLNTQELQDAKNRVDELKKELDELKNSENIKSKLEAIGTALGNLKTDGKLAKNFKQAFESGDIEQMSLALEALEKNMSRFTTDNQDAIQKLRVAFDGLTNEEIIELINKLKDARTEVNNIDNKNFNDFKEVVEQSGQAVSDTTSDIKGMSAANAQAAESQVRLNNELDQMKSRVAYFFSMANAVQLFRRVLQSAFNTVKELDAAMTETATVTDFNVGDMWNRLPEYTAMANELGATTLGAYETMTLFYQQGLETNEAMELGAETMKMARIAGMDYATATDYMTAALRGFNMELNETSAQRVNDVYSELAAITAADTEEIAIAMTKTASIAKSANMEFETTAAFLSQIIETTREAPETAGTAMKTIIARFSEVKSLQNQGKNTGSDEEGEVIDVNRIQTALRSVGISMTDFFNGTEGLDDVLLRLAEKWDSLDFATQRYIATTAAGSRQQSRFIAMMQDYGRTTELVTAANNSAGASQQQFDKTLESLEAKLNLLQNAWNEFALGIADSELIKLGIEILTKLLEIINDITGAFGDTGGMIAKIGIAFAAFKLGGPIVEKIFANLYLGYKKTTDRIKAEALQDGNEIGGRVAQGVQKSTSVQGVQRSTSFGSSIKDPYAPLYSDIKTTSTTKGIKGFFERSGERIGQGWDITKTKAKNNWNEVKTKAKETGVKIKQGTSRMIRGTSEKDSIRKQEDAMAGIKSSLTSKANAKAFAQITDQFEKAAKDGTDSWSAIISKTKISPKALNNLGLADAIKQQYSNAISEATKDGANPQLIETGQQNMANFDAAVLSNDTNAMNTALQQMDISLEGTDQKLNATRESLVATGQAAEKNVTQGFQAASMACMGLSMAAGGVATMLEKMGFEKGAEAAETFSTVLGVLGTVLMLIPPLCQAIGDSIETIPIIGWIAAIIAAVIALIAVIVSLWPESKAEKMERLKKETEEAKNAANEAKEAYSQMLEDLSGYEEIQNALKKCTKGTLEWKQALVEANQNVLDLIGKYTILSKYVTTGSEGQLQISQEGWDSLLQQQQLAVSNAQGYAVSKSNDIYQENIKTAEENYKDDFKSKFKYTDDQDQEKTDEDTLKKIEELYKKDPSQFIKDKDGNYGSELINLINNSKADISTDDIPDLLSALNDYTAALTTNTQLIEDSNSAVLKSKIDTELLTNSDTGANTILDSFSEGMDSDTYDKAVKDLGNDLYDKDGDAEAKENEKFKALAEKYNVTDQMVNDDKKDLQTLYKAMAGVEEIPASIKDDKEKMAKAIAKMEYQNQTAENLESAMMHYNSLSEKQQKDISGVLSDGGKLLTKTLSKELLKEDGTLNEAKLLEMAKNMGYATIDDWAASMNKSGEDFKTEVLEGAQIANNGFKEAADKIANLNISDEKREQINSLTSGLNYESVVGINEMINIAYSKGDQQGNNFIDMLNNSLNGLSESDKLKALNAIGSIDMHSLESIDDLPGVMESMGVSAEALASIDFSTMKSELKILGDAISDFSTEKVVEQVKNLANLKLNLQSGTQGRKFSEEDYNTLINAVPELASEFTMDLDGNYIYLGTSMDNLTTAVRENTQALLQNKIQELSNKLGVADLVDFQNQWDKWDINNRAEWTQEDKERYVGQQIKIANEEGINLGTIEGIESSLLSQTVSKDGVTYANNWTPEQLDSFINAFATEYANKDMTLGELSNLSGAMTTEYQTQGGVENSRRATEIRQELDNVDEQGNPRQNNKRDNVNDAALKAELEARQKALIANAGSLGISEQKISKYSSALETLSTNTDKTTTEYKEAKAAVEDFEREVANTASIKKSNNLMAEKMSTLKELGEEYENAVDQEEKLNAAQKMGDQFGIEVDTGNMDEVYRLTQRLAEGSYDAYVELMNLSGQDYSIQVTANGDFSGLNGEIEFSGQKYTDYINSMLESGDFVEEEIDFDNWQDYIGSMVPIYSDVPGAPSGTPKMITGYKIVKDKADLDGQVSVVRPKKAGEIKTSSRKAGTGSKGGGGGGGKGGGGSSKTEKWENPYDWLYNLTEDINEQIRIREKLERRYNKILEARKTTANTLYENTLKEIEALKKQEELQEEMLSKRQQEMKDYIKKNKSLNKYATYNWSDNTIEINWDKINKVTSTTTGEKIEKYVSKLEELQDAMDEAQDSLYDIEDDLQEVIERGKDEYFGLEDLVYEALQQFYQDQIDTMSEVNDTINDTNSKLIDTIQSQVDKIRQDRENEKTEEELADKQRRLIYLQQDTSGANDLEILQLQEELEQGQQDYTDTLIDQKISALQEQNDKAAEQRERQITLAQAQLDYAIEHGQLWQEVYALMDSGINGSNGLIKGSDLEKLFKDGEAYTSLSTLGKMEWLEETNDQIALAINYLRIGRQLENLSMAGQTISFTTSDGKTLSGTIAEDGTVTADGHKYEDIYQTESGDFYTDETYVAPKQEEKDEIITPTPPSTPSSTKPILKKGATVQVKAGQKWYGNSQGGGGSGRAKSGRIKYINTKGKYPYNIDGKGWIKKSSIVGYKTGGMADFTGPAWLDGTPSKPEYILNAEQTKGFFRLIDVLGGLSKKDSNETSSGDNYFDIDVNVEEIGSDYDVDQIAERIKQLIYTDSMYRNVNAVRIIK